MFKRTVVIFVLIVAVVAGARPNSGLSASATAEQLQSTAFTRSLEWTRDSRSQAVKDYVNAAASWLIAGEGSKAAECLRQASRQQTILADDEDARRLLKRALAIEDKGAGRSATLSLLSLASLKAGKLTESRRFLGESATLAAQASDHEALALSAYSFAEYLYSNRDFETAIRHYEQSLQHWRQIGNLREEANSLVSEAYAKLAIQDPFGALEMARNAESIFERLRDGRGLALSRIAIGHIYSVLDKKQSALDAYKQAADGFPDGLDTIERARLYNGMGLIYEDHGDWSASLKYREDALENFRKENYPNGQLATLPSLVKLSYMVGDDNAAENYLVETERLSNNLRADIYLAVARQYAGDHFLEIGSQENAKRMYNSSMEVFKKNGESYQTALLLVNLGKISSQIGGYETARQHFTQALGIHRQIRTRFGEADALYNLAELEALQTNYEPALASVRQSILITEELYEEMSLSDLRSKYYSGSFSRYSLLVDLLMKRVSDTVQTRDLDSLRVLEKARARKLYETIMITGSDPGQSIDPVTAEKESNTLALLNLKLDNLTDALSHGLLSEVQQLESEITMLRSELDMVRAELKQKSPIYSAIKDPPEFDLADFQTNVLGANDVLVEYFLGKDQSYLWLVGKNEFEAFVLPGREKIEGQVDAIRGLIDARKPVAGESFEQMRERVVAADAAYAPLARQLSDMILGPVAGKIAGKRLIVVPDGKLHYFSINALPLPKSDSDEPILLTNEVVYQPSAQTLSLLTKFRSGISDDRNRDLLVFSDPVFSRDDARLSGVQTARVDTANPALNLRFAESLNGLQRLPGSGQEAEEIAGIVGGQTDRFTGFDANRARLLEVNISDYKVIHLATHGIVNQERPELSAVILSRFDESGRPLDESVRLQDIYAMKLNADLVVLSACQTAAGKEIRGEGVMGLNSAFLQAGARSVVASLWQVDDNASNQLMREFYSGMAKGLPVSSALRQAQIALYRDPQFRSPFFWAAYTLQGDMNRRPDIGRSFSSWWFAAVPLGLVIVLVVLVRRSRRRVKGSQSLISRPL